MKKTANSNKNGNKRVFVALSGGVDSAVAAALLKKQGYDITGVFMRFWKPRINADKKLVADRRGWENNGCSVESEVAARRVAEKLDIPFLVFDFEAEFKKAVVDYFLQELRASRTPNPCAVCNPEIKFGLFLARAKKMGAGLVATGHYARVKSQCVIISETKNLRRVPRNFNEVGRMSALPEAKRSFAIAQDDNTIFKLFSAKDKQKDQSYFLYRLRQKQLGRIIFPLGRYTKDEVYKLAKKWRLSHQARQSFDVCFARDYSKFLKKYLKLKPGKIADLTGGALGEHRGLPFYTIGQRANVGGPGPFFVVKKDIRKNILYVSDNERDLYQKEALVEKINWVAGSAPKMSLRCKIKIRYGGKAAKSFIVKRQSRIVVIFDKPQRAITSGQSAVFYGRRGEVLGGGTIK